MAAITCPICKISITKKKYPGHLKSAAHRKNAEKVQLGLPLPVKGAKTQRCYLCDCVVKKLSDHESKPMHRARLERARRQFAVSGQTIHFIPDDPGQQSGGRSAGPVVVPTLFDDNQHIGLPAATKQQGPIPGPSKRSAPPCPDPSAHPPRPVTPPAARAPPPPNMRTLQPVHAENPEVEQEQQQQPPPPLNLQPPPEYSRGGIRGNIHYLPIPRQQIDAVYMEYGQEVGDCYVANAPYINRYFQPVRRPLREPCQWINIRIPVEKVSVADILNHVEQVFREEWLPKLMYKGKMLISFGSILRRYEPEPVVEYFYPGNRHVTEEPVFLNSHEFNLGDYINHETFERVVQASRENSTTEFVMATNCQIRIFHTDRLLGRVGCGHEVNSGILNDRRFIYNPANSANESGKLCVFQCINRFKNKNNQNQGSGIRSLEKYLNWQDLQTALGSKLPFKLKRKDVLENGVPLLKEGMVASLEECFKCNLNVYTLENEQPYRRSRKQSKRPVLYTLHRSCFKHAPKKHTANLIVDGKDDDLHCYLIVNFDKLFPAFGCSLCNKQFAQKSQLLVHEKKCEGGTKIKYKAQYVKRYETVFDSLEHFNVNIPHEMRRNPHRVVFDIETFEEPLPEGMDPNRGKGTVIEGVHRLVSWSAVSNVPGFTEPVHKCDKTLTQSRSLCMDLNNYLVSVKKASARMWHEKNEKYYRIIQEMVIKMGGQIFIHPEQKDRPSNELIDEMFSNKNLTEKELDAKYGGRIDFLKTDAKPASAELKNIHDTEKIVLETVHNVIHGDDIFEQMEKNPYFMAALYEEKDPPDLIELPQEEKNNGDSQGDGKSKKKKYTPSPRTRHVNSFLQNYARYRANGKVVVMGFNSGKFDLMVLREFIPEVFLTRDISPPKERSNRRRDDGEEGGALIDGEAREGGVELEFENENEEGEEGHHDPSLFVPRPYFRSPIIKKGPSYTLLESVDGLIFLDMMNFLPPGTSLDKCLKVYKANAQKGYFPYAELKNKDFYTSSTPPPYESYQSTLKNTNVLETEWRAISRHLHNNKWRPIVYAVAQGWLGMKKGYAPMLSLGDIEQQLDDPELDPDKENELYDLLNEKDDIFNAAMFHLLYEEGWYKEAYQEPANTINVNGRPEYICKKCHCKVGFIYPKSKVCEACYEHEPIDRNYRKKTKISKSKDDTYTQTYMWFLEQDAASRGAWYPASIYTEEERKPPINTIARRRWEGYSEEERRARKIERDPPRVSTGVEEWLKIRQKYVTGEFQNGEDYLRWYNNLDVVPLLRDVIEPMCEAEWKYDGIDLMKGNVSQSQTARIKVIKHWYKHGYRFTTFGKDMADQEKKQRRCANGGPSIVLNRKQLSGITRVGDKGQGPVTKCIRGYDFNSLYPSCMQNDMPTGPCHLFKPDHQGNWSRTCSLKTGIKQYVWIDVLNDQFEEMKQREISLAEGDYQDRDCRILDDRSSIMRKIGPYIPDGFRPRSAFLDWEVKGYGSEVKGIVYEFNGCFFHGCPCQTKKKNKLTPEKERLRVERYNRTVQKWKDYREMGYVVRSMWECDFDRCIKNDSYPGLRARDRQDMPPYTRKVMTSKPDKRKELLNVFNDPEAVEKLLLEGTDSVFGFMEVDIEDIENNNSHFPILFAPVEMDPGYVDPNYERPEPGTLKYTKKHPVLLTGVTKVVKGLFTTDFLKFAIENGCKITKVYCLQEYVPKPALRDLVCDLQERRAKADKVGATVEEEFRGYSAKVTSNTMFGGQFMNKANHEEIFYVHKGIGFCRAVNNPRFRIAEEIDDENMEVAIKKATIFQDLPTQNPNKILCDAKKKLCQLVMEFNKWIGKENYSIIHCDTDSIYMGMPKYKLEDCILPEMREDFEKRKHEVFVQCECGAKCKNENCDKRKFDLVKLEHKSTHSVALTSKTHTFATMHPLVFSSKVSAKGIPNKTLPIDTLGLYYDTLKKGEKFVAPVAMLQVDKIGPNATGVVRKTVNRTGITKTYNNKRKLLDDGEHTVGYPFEAYCGTPKKHKGLYTEEYYREREERVCRNIKRFRSAALL